MSNSGQKMEQTGDVIEERAKRRDKAESDMRASIARQLAAIPLGKPIGPSTGKHILSRDVDNPMLTDGLVYSGQRNAHMKVKADENAVTRIGALCFVRKREDHHERAAERFKNLYEARYGSGNPAMDPSRIQVDTSPMAHDSGMAGKIDRTVELERLKAGLTKREYNRLVACLVLCISCDEQSDAMPSGKVNWRQSGKCVEETLAALETVSELLGLKSRQAA